MNVWKEVVGPRIPATEFRERRGRYMLPTLLFGLAAILLLISIFTPYWQMTLHAPQYPRGLHLQAFLTHLTGDVAEIDGLNHYIGMRPLGEAATLERSLSIMAVCVLVLLVLAAMFVHSRWAALLALPALGFPVGFLADLYFWMKLFGTNLDPKAPLSAAIKPFVPPVWGEGVVGQFRTVAGPDIGLTMALVASGIIVIGLWAHRRAYKPLVDAGHQAARAAAGALTVLFLCAGAADAFDLRGAIAAAEPGAIVVVPAGLYEGPIEIERPISLQGAAGAVLEGTGKGDVLRITAPDVTIEGFTIRRTGTSLDQENAGITVLADRVTVENNTLEDVLFGVYLKDATDCAIRGNRISGKDLKVARRGDAIRIWHSDGCEITDNEVLDARDVVIWFSKDVHIARNVVMRGRYGLHFMYSDSNLIEDNWLEGNSVGAFLMYSRNLRLERNVFLDNRGPSGYGIGLKDMDGVEAHDNRFLGNRIGIYLDNSPWSVDVYDHFDRNVLAYNDIGVAFLPAVKRNIFRDNTFLENQEQVAVLGSGDFGGNDFTVEGRGNFWSDYKGYDLDGDGIGDVPYKAESLFENLMDREKKLRLFLYGPAQQAVELAARAMPSMKPRPKVADTAPLMDPAPLEAPPLPPRSGRPLALFAAALLFGTLAGLQRARRPDEGKGVATAMELVPAGAAGEPVIRVRSLVKRFGKFTAVDRLDFDVARGEAVALWGENGAGKTTAIKCVLGLLRSQGEIRVAGCDLRTDGKGVRRALGYVAQELALHDDLGTLETLRFYARLKKVPASRAHEVLADVQMEAHAHKKIGELSGGMKQRIALAIALLADPPVLVLDEMTSNLDANSRGGLLGLLERQRARGKTILFTSHRLDEVQALADRVLVMADGRLASDCTPARLPEVLGLRSRLELLFPEADRDRAQEVLVKGGFEVRRNGGPCLRVRVRPAEKLDVLRCLEEAGLYLTDFEMETEAVPREAE